jgi:hypothetical protein
MPVPARVGIIKIEGNLFFDAFTTSGEFPLKSGKRLCLMCFGDWVVLDSDSYCPACQLELEFRLGTKLPSRPVRNDSVSDWNGPSVLQNAYEGTLVDSEDLQFGFYESNLSGAPDAELIRDKRER